MFAKLTGFHSQKPMLINLNMVIEITRFYYNGAEAGCSLWFTQSHYSTVAESFDELCAMFQEMGHEFL